MKLPRGTSITTSTSKPEANASPSMFRLPITLITSRAYSTKPKFPEVDWYAGSSPITAMVARGDGP